MKHIRFILIFLLTIVLSVSIVRYMFFNKTNEEKIEERLNTFANSYSVGDLKGCVSCFDAKSRNAYKALGNLGSLIGGSKGIFSFNLSGDTISSLFSLGTVAGDIKIEVEIKSIDFETESTASVIADFKYSDKYVNQLDELTLKMIKENAAWYDFWSNNWYISEGL